MLPGIQEDSNRDGHLLLVDQVVEDDRHPELAIDLCVIATVVKDHQARGFRAVVLRGDIDPVIALGGVGETERWGVSGVQPLRPSVSPSLLPSVIDVNSNVQLQSPQRAIPFPTDLGARGVSPRENREDGVNPSRSRRCNRGRTPHTPLSIGCSGRRGQ